MDVAAAIFAEVDLYCAIRRDWSFAAAEEDGDGEKHESESGEEVCGEYADEDEGVRGACMTWISMCATRTERAVHDSASWLRLVVDCVCHQVTGMT